MKTPDHLSPQHNAALSQASKKTNFINPIIEKAYHRAELSRIRERIAADLEARKGNRMLIASPNGDTGASLLVAALGYYTAYACQQRVLLIDCNMRHPDLHTFFDLPQSLGITSLVQSNLSGRDIIKGTETERLYIITTGSVDNNIAAELRHFHIQNLFKDIQGQFDLIICDTSPVLENNLNIASLSSVTDYCILVIKKLVTTQGQLKKAQNIIASGNGKIDAIIINEHDTDKSPLNQLLV